MDILWDNEKNQLLQSTRFVSFEYVVPMVIDQNGDWFLKTIYPSQKEKGRPGNGKDQP
jgi:hypothetical protein